MKANSWVRFQIWSNFVLQAATIRVRIYMGVYFVCRAFNHNDAHSMDAWGPSIESKQVERARTHVQSKCFWLDSILLFHRRLRLLCSNLCFVHSEIDNCPCVSALVVGRQPRESASQSHRAPKETTFKVKFHQSNGQSVQKRMFTLWLRLALECIIYGSVNVLSSRATLCRHEICATPKWC